MSSRPTACTNLGTHLVSTCVAPSLLSVDIRLRPEVVPSPPVLKTTSVTSVQVCLRLRIRYEPVLTLFSQRQPENSFFRDSDTIMKSCRYTYLPSEGSRGGRRTISKISNRLISCAKHRRQFLNKEDFTSTCAKKHNNAWVSTFFIPRGRVFGFSIPLSRLLASISAPYCFPALSYRGR